LRVKEMVTQQEIIDGFMKAIVDGEEEKATEWAKEAVNANMDAYTLVTKYGGDAMGIVNTKYEKKEYFVPEVLCAANALSSGVAVLSPHMKVDKTTVPAVVVLGVCEGDIHDIGKNLVRIMLSAAGFKVIDLGKDVPHQKFIDTAKENKADIVGMSALMSTTMPGMKRVIGMMQEQGIRNKVKVIVGGGPVTKDWALSIGADDRPHDASASVVVVKELVEKLKTERGQTW
jgi:corrinoid protein of di/trimethylamine methyltransferase